MKNKSLVIKIGSSGVTHEMGGADPLKMMKLMNDLIKLHQDYDLFLVSSGAINSGKHNLTLKPENNLTYQQAASAVGQPLLMNEYQQLALKLNLKIAQILVTHEDFKKRERFLNIRNTLLYLCQENILPIINENDTVSTKEITVGDNDQLAVMIAQAVGADALIILSESDGLFDRDPKDPQAKKIAHVDYNQDLSSISFGQKTSAGRGGMSTKIQAIQKLTPLGLDVYLGSYQEEKPVLRLLNQKGGTLFKAHPKEKIKSRKAWIASVIKPGAVVMIDDGAKKALLKNGSLLPVGVKKIAGHFKRGDVVMIKNQNKTVGMGISEYDSKEADKIKGQHSQDLHHYINVIHHDVLIHKDNLYLIKES